MAVMSSPSTDTFTPSLTAATSALVANSTSAVSATEASQSSRPSKTTIALLAVIGSVVVSVFVGCFIYSQVKNYRARRSRHPSKPLASLSLNLSMGRGTQTSSGLSAREANATEPRRAGPAHEVSRGTEEKWSPQSPPQQQASQTKEMSVKDEEPEEPQYRFASHPYQAATQDSTSSLPTNPANQSQADMRSLALALPVSSHAPGTQGSSSSRLTFVGHAARGSQSSSGHVTSESAGKSDEAMIPPSRPPLKISTTPPVQNHASNPKLSEKKNLLERRYSKSFLVLDDRDSPTSTSHPVSKPPSSLPAMLEHVPGGTSDPGGWPAPPSAKMMTVVASYTPRLQDELSLNVGDVVKLVQEYDDGWCVVEQVGTTNVGTVPKVCLHGWAST